MLLLSLRVGPRSSLQRVERCVSLASLCPDEGTAARLAGYSLEPEPDGLQLRDGDGRLCARLEPGGRFELAGIELALDPRSRAEGTERLEPELTRALVLELPDGRCVPLEQSVLSLGSHPDCTVRLDDRSVSRLHCLVRRTPGAWLVCDQDSRNGTWVSGVRVQSAVLHDGAELLLGRSRVYVSAQPAQPDEKLERAIERVLVGPSEAMQRLRALVARYATRVRPALVLGETGTGKELVARLLHEHSNRASKPYVTLSAADLSPELIESELFGHEKGSFTGAVARRKGVFEEADGGTLFLDEIGELPLLLQAKLLRVLETREFRRVGGEGSRRADVRVVCATHRDLRAMAEEGTFRRDLLERLDVLRLELPPLRERDEDMPALCAHLLARISVEERRYLTMDPSVLPVLLSHDWPGNVRELYNALVRGVVRSDDARLRGEHLALHRERAPLQSDVAPKPELDGNALHALLEHQCAGNLSLLAQRTGIARSTLRDRLARYRSERKTG